MKKLLAILALTATCGCMNLYTRCPGTQETIQGTYQCTQVMTVWTCVTAFPQVMAPDEFEFMPINLLTVPLAIFPLADTVLEACVDTVCYPYDMTRGKPNRPIQLFHGGRLCNQ